MPKLTIDGIEIEVENGMTVLQACEEAGVEIPRFCYHERLSIAGNCRMCLVEIEKMPKLAASCAMPAGEGMVVHTRSDKVRRARNNVMEFQLINHPLDCPICDQGGECDLQDEAMAYGLGEGRFTEDKHAFEAKHMGPLIKTMMNRCIHCTRCVRFIAEIAGTEEMGATGRGGYTEIMTYLQSAITSELSGNVIDLCPVGALTSRPYAFSARPWELRKTESVDVMDAVGSNIRVDSRGAAVMRVMPRNHDDVNEEWLADRSRFIWDGLKSRRLDRPYVRKDGQLVEADWDEALALVAEKLKSTDGARIGAIAGDLCAAEEMFALKGLMAGLGAASLDCRQDGAALEPSAGRAGYLFNPGIAGIEEADALMLIGANPRRDAPVLNARIRKRWLRGGFEVGLIGENADLTYDTTHLGAGPDSLAALIDDENYAGQSEHPMVIVGADALARPDGAAVLALAAKFALKRGAIKPDWNGFAVLHNAASRVAGLDLGLTPGAGGQDAAAMVSGGVDVLYLLGADEIDMSGLGETFVIYQGSHGDAGAHRADVILPGAAYTEKDGIYVNTEGRAQSGRRAVMPPGEAREDWKIIRALSGALGAALPYDTLEELRAAMFQAAPVLAELDSVPQADAGAVQTLAGQGGSPSSEPFRGGANHYLVNPILRASKTMHDCVAASETEQEATGTDA
ncbi:MAG: NADH-quinone oxidoreductase subunit G [Hyphomicrobiales bacterium]|nr:MAG: NADH-quinone oxidoreductase subunit G [Hyphomicrobiales bacterium]